MQQGHPEFSLDDVRDVVFRTDAEGRWTFLNRAWTDVTGFSREETLGRSFLSSVHPEDRARFLEILQPLARREREHCLDEVRCRTKDGGSRWCEVHLRFTLGPDGATTGTAGTLRDVTARRDEERAHRDSLEQHRNQLARALAGSRLGYWEWELGSDELHYNEDWPGLLGYGRHEIQPRFLAWASLVHEEDLAKVQAAIVAHVKRLSPELDVEYRMRARDGSWRWIHSRAQVVAWAGSRALRLAGTHADVSRRREAEERLREVLATNERLVQELRVSENRLRLALASGNHVEWDWDVPARSVAFGERLQEMFGCSAEELVTWTRLVHPRDVGRVLRGLAACAAGRRAEYEERFRIRHGSGGWRWVRSRGSIVERDAAGGPRRVVGTITDVNERVELQEKLLAATRLASVGTLAAGVAHEINNPLAWVTANLDHARELAREAMGSDAGEAGEAKAELLQVLDEAVEGAQRIASVVRSMRSLGRPERAEEAREVDLRAEILNAVQMVRNQLVARARLLVEVPDGLPRTRARTNELGRVFVNLLVNAAQAIPEGDPGLQRISVSARAAGGEIVVEVADTGRGMPPDVRARIFDAFFTTKAPGVGTGLGLTMAKSIVEGAGGALEVETAPGAGTVFTVRLPLVGAGEAERATPGAGAPAPASGPARRVLVLDDEPLAARALARWLGRAHEVTVFTSAREALARLEADDRWDAILCDVMMPDVDGIAFYEGLRARRPALAARIAFMTGGVFGERVPRFLASNDVPTLAKPLRQAAVLAAVEALATGARPAVQAG